MRIGNDPIGPAATRFFAKALSSNGIPDKIVIDKSGAKIFGIREINRILKQYSCPATVQVIRSKYLNNIVEQDLRFIKRRVRHICGFKSFGSASATLDGFEVANMIRKKQFPNKTISGFRLYVQLAG
ncbi:DDE-type integrase/transposase/recombinase [Ruegeria lacuscaerulensis]|uniref:DDE-type integrase/transposase/recombinase n=1 Tax=Ruegeria lacuscaerulensis TaxID=55218 RepID=UPI00147B26D3|nr:DDE-type integrase/transposase/recombinase [Ruegeria lacuscaerulensis]